MSKRSLAASLSRVSRMLKLRTPNVAIVDDTEPIVAHYLYSPQQFITTVPIHTLRAFGPVSFRMEHGDRNPFSRALRQEEDSEATRQLQEFYDVFSPDSAAQLLGVSIRCDAESCALANLPPSHYVLPWEREHVSAAARRRRNQVHAEHRRAVGGETDSGYPHWGPNSEHFCLTELKRLRHVYRSIKENGYSHLIRDTVGIRCTLAHGNEMRYVVRKGHHRVAALSALGESQVRVRFNERWPAVVDRDHAEFWPQVRSGLFTEHEAITVFDRLFAGATFEPGHYELTRW